MPTFEYRKFFRVNIALKVCYKTLEEPLLEGVAFSKNLSANGINIIMTDRLAKGTELELQIYIFESEKPIIAKAQIIWQENCPYVSVSKRQYYSTGIQLINMSGEDAIKISDFVRSVLMRHSEVENKKIIEMIEGLKRDKE